MNNLLSRGNRRQCNTGISILTSKIEYQTLNVLKTGKDNMQGTKSDWV